MSKSNHYLNQNNEQIDFTVHVTTRPNLRDGTGEMFMYRGHNILETMFDKCVVDPNVTAFDMEYPERWANILEQRAISSRMLVCFPNLKSAYIKTHSVYIIQTVHSEHIGILDIEERGKYREGNYKNLTVRYCNPADRFAGLWNGNVKIA